MERTLAVNRLGITGGLLGTTQSTSPLSSMIETVRDHCHRMRQQGSGEETLRVVVAGMRAAERGFRRVNGHRELLRLGAALVPER